MLKNKIEQNDHEAEILDLEKLDIPLFRERFVDMKSPEQRYLNIFQSLKEADAIIIVTPEYNSSITPALKNILDIYGRQGFGHKPVAVASVSSGGKGGVLAAHHLQMIMLSLDGQLFPKILATGNITETINENGKVTDLEYLKVADQFLDRYISFVESIGSFSKTDNRKCA
jgi:azobenzene reductase